MSYLAPNTVVSKVIEYINGSRQNEAIIIDGDYGAGNNFFIQNILIAEIKKNIKKNKDKERTLIYISFYGIRSCKQVSALLGMNNVSTMLKPNNEEYISKNTDILSKIVSIVTIFFNKETIEFPLLSDSYKLIRPIIIFDDLEQCCINENEILAYINNLVEKNEFKIIIVNNKLKMSNSSKDIEYIKRGYAIDTINESFKDKENLDTNLHNYSEKYHNKMLSSKKFINLDKLSKKITLIKKSKSNLIKDIGLIKKESNKNQLNESSKIKYTILEKVILSIISKLNLKKDINHLKEAVTIDKVEFSKINKLNSKENIQNVKKDNDKNEINECFRYKDWGINFNGYCKKYHNRIISRNKFIALIDVDILLGKIILSDTENIDEFNNGLDIIYSFTNLNDFFKEDVLNIRNFKMKLETAIVDDYNWTGTKKIALERTEKKIEEILKLIVVTK